MKVCKFCGQEIENTKKKCPACGSMDLLHVCDNCKTHFDGNFCPNCGVKVGQQGKTCPECGTLYYTNACPNCGHKGNQKEPMEKTVVHKHVYVNSPAPAPAQPATKAKGKQAKGKKKRSWLVWVIAILVIAGLAGGNSKKSTKTDNRVADTQIEAVKQETNTDTTSSKTDIIVESSEPKASEAQEEEMAPHYDVSLKGRGMSDVGVKEPDYVNVIGYAAVYEDQETNISNARDFMIDDLWMVPVYEQDKQFWNQVGHIPHKTEVIVREQKLERKLGTYIGYLLVERTDDGTKHYINVNNFVTRAYWNNPDIAEAAKEGCFVAEFKQISDYYPVDGNGNKAELTDGTILLVRDTTGIRPKVGKDNDILAVRWDEQGNHKAYYINHEDLKILR